MAADPWAVLGVERGADADEVKRAFKRAVAAHHPDKHATAPAAAQAEAAARFEAAQEAYRLLSDDRKRAAYEAGRATGYASAYGGAATDWSTQRPPNSSGGGGYTSRISNWELLRRYARDGVKSLDRPLHVALAVAVAGGALLFDFTHERLWAARNKGKRFEDVAAAAKERRRQSGGGEGPEDAAAAAASASTASAGEAGGAHGGGGSGGGTGTSSSSSGGRSAWMDRMRGRDVAAQEGEAAAAAARAAGQTQAQAASAAAEGAPGSRREDRAAAADVDRATAPLRASPAGQMAGHR